MCRRKKSMFPFILLGMLIAAALYLIIRFVFRKCRDAEKAVTDCISEDCLCECECDSDS